MLDKILGSRQAVTTGYTRQTDNPDLSRRPRTRQNHTQTGPVDKVSIRGESAAAVTSSGPLPTGSGEDVRYGIFRKLVADLLKEQGVEITIRDRDANIDITALTPEQAEELVDDDGYFGVRHTSERIFRLAIGIAGGDPNRIDAIRQGIDRGFQEALDAFGGSLPDISHATYDAVMEKLDQWAARSDGSENE